MTWPKMMTCRPDDNVARNVVHVCLVGLAGLTSQADLDGLTG